MDFLNAVLMRPTDSQNTVMPRGGVATSVVCLVCTACLAACSSAVGGSAKELPLAASFSRTSAAIQSEGQWWTEFGDAHLNAWVERGLASNYSLAATWARLSQSRADARIASADIKPTVDGTLDAGARRSGSGLNTKSGVFWSLGVAASYELDLWGSQSAVQDEAKQNVAAAALDVETAAISLAAEIAIGWYRWVEARKQFDLRVDQRDTNEQVLALVEARYARGLVSAHDVFRQRQVVDAAKHSEYAATAEAKRWHNRLAQLLGHSPTKLRLPDEANLPNLGPLPGWGTPVEVIQRRPDMRAAMHRLAAADARVAAAVANRYPRLSLRANASTSPNDGDLVSGLFQNWLVSLASNVLAPIWDGGRRAAQAQRARAAAKVAWFQYADAALSAVVEVEDALLRDEQAANEAASIARQLELASRALEIARAGYAAGRANYLQILDAVLTTQELQRRQLATRREALEARIALYRAIAGPSAAPNPEPPGP